MKMLLRTAFFASAFVMFLGLIGVGWHAYTSSSVRTAEFSREFAERFKGETRPRVFYLSEAQARRYEFFDKMFLLGGGAVLITLLSMWMESRRRLR